MKRNISNEVKKYDSMGHSSAWDEFYASDYQQIYEMGGTDLFELITIALKVGYMRGYKRAKRDYMNK